MEDRAGGWSGAGIGVRCRRGARDRRRPPRAHAAAIAGLQIATGLPAPTVSARLSGSGRTRTVAYRATKRDGLTVTLLEQGRGFTRELAPTRTAGNGSVRFTTGDLPGGRRTVIAVLEQEGAPRLRKVVASYNAPAPPRPARVRGVTVLRSGNAAVVRWRPSRGAAGYLVRVTVADGRRVARVLPASARSLRIARVAPRYAVAATVAARTRGAKLGPAGAGRAAAVRPRPPRRARGRR